MMYCNPKPFLTIVFLFSFSAGNTLYSQGRIWFAELGVDIKQEQKIQYSGGDLQISPAYGFFFNIHNGGKRMAIGFHMDYSRVNLEKTPVSTVPKKSVSLWEMYAGLRYYPLLPTMRLGSKVALRFTAGGMIGGYSYYWRQTEDYTDGTVLKWSPLQFSPVVFAGFCFSSFRNTTGLSVKLNYRPQTFSLHNFELENFTLKQPFSISAGLLVGPKVK